MFWNASFLNILNVPFQYFVLLKQQLFFCGYWVGLGVLSSVGLGTGLHTFILYLVRFFVNCPSSPFTFAYVIIQYFTLFVLLIEFSVIEGISMALLSCMAFFINNSYYFYITQLLPFFLCSLGINPLRIIMERNSPRKHAGCRPWRRLMRTIDSTTTPKPRPISVF